MHGTFNLQKVVHSKGAGEALGSPAMLTRLSSSNFLPMPKNSLHAHGKFVKHSRASVDENAGFASLAVDVSRIPHKLHAGCHCGKKRVVAEF